MNTTKSTYTIQAALIAATLGLEMPEADEVNEFVAEHIDELPPFCFEGGYYWIDDEA